VPGAAIALFAICADAGADESWSSDCVEEQMHIVAPTTTVAELKTICANTAENTGLEDKLIESRIIGEQAAAKSRFAVTAHRRNFFLPLTYMVEPNEEPFADLAGGQGVDLDNIEAKFQLSVKTTLFDNVLKKNDAIQFGFTAASFWQVYNKEISSPFRETNYEPEVFWLAPFRWTPWGVDTTLLAVGFSHQSNGQAGSLSRSWNRLYANFIWEKGDYVFSFKPWYRIPESNKKEPGDPRGDDNPDIGDYMGNFEFTTVYKREHHEFSAMLRNNLSSDNKGAIQVEWTFPLFKNLRGYAQYFNGYGESLIDYNERIERIGVGFLLTDLL
jgi:phospholipase A1